MFKKFLVVFGLVFAVLFQVTFALNNTWDLNTVGEYTLSDVNKIEITAGVAKIQHTQNGYHTDVGLNVISNNALTFTEKINSFSVTKSTPGDSELTYLVSSDNGVTWMCLGNGQNGLEWFDYNDMMCNGPNTESEINDNIETLDTDGGEFKWKVFLKSYPPAGYGGPLTDNGVNTPEL